MASTPNERFNILFVVSDQEYAHQAIPAGVSLPNHERLRATGVTFVNQQVTTTVCTPSRSVMLTGQHTPHTGMWDNTNMAWISEMDPELPTVGHMLRDAGYYTAFKGKWHLSELPAEGTEDALEPYGFADFQEWGDTYGAPLDGYRRDPDVADEAASWLRTRAADLGAAQPWFLAVNFVNPHDIMFLDTDPDGGTQRSELFPIFPAPDVAPYTDELAVELPASFDADLSAEPEGVQAYAHLCDVSYGEIPRDSTDQWLRHVNYYVNCIRDVDRHLGTVLDALEASGQAENTIVLYTSDHGELAGAHGLRQKGGVVYRETVNVPLIVAHPAGPKGVETHAVGSHLDYAPTLLGFAGVSEAERRSRRPDLHGHDLSGVIHDPDSDGPRGSSQRPGRGALYTYDMLSSVDIDWTARVAAATIDMGDAEVVGTDGDVDKGRVRTALETMSGVLHPDFGLRHNLRGVFDGRHKLVRYFALDGYNTPQDVEALRKDNDVALYDLRTDPEERENLANPDHTRYDEELLVSLNAKLDALIRAEIGTDKALVKRPLLTVIGSTISEKLRARF